MIKYHNVEQGSDAWWDLRKGMMTGSKATAIGNNGRGLITYCNNLKSGIVDKGFEGEHTKRGHELEWQARELYSLQTGFEVEEIGFITNDAISSIVGVSPDGMMSTRKRGIEIKSLCDEKHQKMIDNFKIDSGHMWQMQLQILIGEFEYVDYVLFNPNFEEDLIICGVFPDSDKQDALLRGIRQGELLLK